MVEMMAKVCEEWFPQDKANGIMSYKNQRSPGFYMHQGLKDTIDLWVKNVKNDWDFVIIISGQGTVRVGKTSSKDSNILMVDGSWKNITKIKVGDAVFSPDVINGGYTTSKVIETHTRFEDECYDIIANRSGEKLYTCAYNHDIPFEYVTNSRKNMPDGSRKIIGYKRHKVKMEARELFNKSKHFYRDNSPGTYQGFLIEHFDGRTNPEVDAYALGYFLGNGSSSNTSSTMSISSNNPECLRAIEEKNNIMSVRDKPGTTCKDYFFSAKDDFQKQITELNLRGHHAGTKFIPREALLADADYRFKLLSGLIDSDGYIDDDGRIVYTSKSEKLIEDIQELVRSLGGQATKKKITKGIKSTGFVGEYFNSSISLGKNTSRLTLHNNLKKGRLKLDARLPLVGFHLKKSKPQQVYGFELDSPSHLYITDDYVITHNSVLAQQIACYWTYAIWKAYGVEVPFDTKDNIVFHGHELIKKGNKLGKKHKMGCLIFDEAGADLEGVKAMKKSTQNVKDFFRECGQYNMLSILCLPEFFDLPKGIATNRSNALIDCYVTVDDNDMWERGKFNFFSAPAKKNLYRWGKKDGNYAASKPDFYGDWDNVYVLPEEEYRKMKVEALKTREVVNEREDKRMNYLRGCVKILATDFELTYREIARRLTTKSKFSANHMYISRLLAGEKNPEEEDD